MSAPFKVGAIVHEIPHALVFAADLYEVAGAVVVRANGPVVRGRNAYAADSAFCATHKPTHELRDCIGHEFWADELGVFVVPAKCLTEVRSS